MTVRVAINGFGRIGRQSLKAIIERTDGVEVVAINDLVETEINALLFRYDSTYGRYDGAVDHTDDALIVDGREIRVTRVPHQRAALVLPSAASQDERLRVQRLGQDLGEVERTRCCRSALREPFSERSLRLAMPLCESPAPRRRASPLRIGRRSSQAGSAPPTSRTSPGSWRTATDDVRHAWKRLIARPALPLVWAGRFEQPKGITRVFKGGDPERQAGEQHERDHGHHLPHPAQALRGYSKRSE